MSNAYFERVDEQRFRPTPHTGGGWDPTELHFSPLGGLIVHAIERHRAGRATNGMLLGRISFDILGRLPSEECEIVVTTARGGRTIELIDATVRIGGRDVALAHAWYSIEQDTTVVAGGAPQPFDGPDQLATWPMSTVWPGGFVASLEVRPLRPLQPGRATVWVSTAIDLVAGEAASTLASFVALIDIANGIGARERPDNWMFPNLDLTIHLLRQPNGSWVGLDTTTTFGPAGQGITSTVLHDLAGPIGYANQILTVRPAPK